MRCFFGEIATPPSCGTCEKILPFRLKVHACFFFGGGSSPVSAHPWTRSRIVVWRLAKLPQRHNTNTRRLFWVASQRVQALCVFGGSPAPSLLYVMSMRVFNTGASPCRLPYNTFTRSLYLRRVACPRSRHDVLVHCCFGGSPIACLAYHVRALLFIRAARQPMFFIRTTPAPWSSILVWLLLG